jgi:hypothetical protein
VKQTTPPTGALPASILASRLAVDWEGPPPTIDDLGLGDAKKAAFEWQQQRSRAGWNGLVTGASGRTASDWVLEIHGMFGVIGEQVLVAAEAEVEKEIAVRRLAQSPAEAYPARAHYSRSLRFFAEGQANALTVAGHGLANLTLRTLALAPAFDVSHVKAAGVSAGDFVPGSEAKKAWVSLTPSTVAALQDAAGNYSDSMQALAQEFADLAADPGTTELIDFRNVQYHRWRGESPGVTGIDVHGATARQQLEQSQGVGISGQMLPAYTDGQAALDDLVRLSRNALDSLVTRMPSFHRTWYAAFSEAFA